MSESRKPLVNLPSFRSEYLSNIARRFEQRRKALRHQGKISWDTKQPDEFEWLTVKFIPLLGNYCIFQFAERNRAWIYVRSKRRANRGKVLFSIENVTLFDNAAGIINAAEITIAHSEGLLADNPTYAASVIRETWRELEVRLAKDPDTMSGDING